MTTEKQSASALRTQKPFDTLFFHGMTKIWLAIALKGLFWFRVVLEINNIFLWKLLLVSLQMKCVNKIDDSLEQVLFATNYENEFQDLAILRIFCTRLFFISCNLTLESSREAALK